MAGEFLKRSGLAVGLGGLLISCEAGTPVMPDDPVDTGLETTREAPPDTS